MGICATDRQKIGRRSTHNQHVVAPAAQSVGTTCVGVKAWSLLGIEGVVPMTVACALGRCLPPLKVLVCLHRDSCLGVCGVVRVG